MTSGSRLASIAALRVAAVEAALEGAVIDAGVADHARTLVQASIEPIDDVRSTAAYRREVSGRILARALQAAAG
ncbi:MAG: hypothetical protein U0667_15525 [Chloroflexota bacterium]